MSSITNSDHSVVLLVANKFNDPSNEPAQFWAQFADDIQPIFKMQQ